MDNIFSVLEHFPSDLKNCFLSFDVSVLSKITEIRLRVNKPIVIYILDKPFFISKYDKLINHYLNDCRFITETIENKYKLIIANKSANND